MSALRILLINHYAGSVHHGMEFRPYYLAREWLRAGHQVRILAASVSHLRLLNPAAGSGPVWESIDGIEYVWYPTPAYDGNGVRRVANMMSFVWQLYRASKLIAREFQPDVVIASSTYPMDIWPARRIALAAGARLIFEVHDLWPLTPMELGGMSKLHPFILLLQQAEDYAYRHSDAVVSLLPAAIDHMTSRGLPSGKFNYIPNGVNPDEWDVDAELPESAARMLRQVQAKGRPIMGYAGGHGLSNALDSLLDAAALLQGVAEIVMIGNGPERERLAQRVTSEGLENVTMMPALAKRCIPAFLRMVDIAYMGMKSESIYRFGISPNKLVDYMMAGRPIVLAAEAGNDPVGEAGCGLTVKPDDPAAICAAVHMLLGKSQGERDELGANGRRFVLGHRTYRVLAERFLRVCRG